jgi:hypothetical protein
MGFAIDPLSTWNQMGIPAKVVVGVLLSMAVWFIVRKLFAILLHR